MLAPFGWLFGGITGARQKLYQKGFFKSIDLGVPVISVGNLTVGGTGKTPLVAFIAKVLAQKNHQVCVLTRGYGRANPNERVLVSDGNRILVDAQRAGDEPFELAHKLLGSAAVIADKSRYVAGIWARENLKTTAFVLDDGFQHLQIKRDVDIVCVDATNPFGNGKLLPAGILREPLTSLRRADGVIVTRTDLAAEVQSLKFKIQSLNQTCPILLSKTQIIGLYNIREFLAKAQSAQREKLREKPNDNDQKAKHALAFCALGNSDGFFESLRQADFSLKATKAFSDHYVYKQIDVGLIETQAKANGAELLLTTAKDAVKFQHLEFSLPCFVVEIEIVFEDDEPLLRLFEAL